MIYNPKTYYDNDRTLEWGKDLTEEQITAMENGEIFTLLDKDGKPYSRVVKDSYGQTREQKFIIEDK